MYAARAPEPNSTFIPQTLELCTPAGLSYRGRRARVLVRGGGQVPCPCCCVPGPGLGGVRVCCYTCQTKAPMRQIESAGTVDFFLCLLFPLFFLFFVSQDEKSYSIVQALLELCGSG